MNDTYVRPSQCESCVPVETRSTGNSMAWTVELAHEESCPNRPKGTR